MPDRPCTLRLYKLSFEQEEPIRRTAGGFRTCTADPTAEIILFTCDTDPALAGAELRIYDGFLDVIGDDRETLEKLTLKEVNRIIKKYLSVPGKVTVLVTSEKR